MSGHLLANRSITRVRVSDLHMSGVSPSKLALMLAESYQEPSRILVRELEKCDTAYLLSDGNADLEAFFLVRYSHLRHAGELIPAVYLGLSASRQSAKNTGSVRDLYAAMLLDARAFEEGHHCRVVLWYTTATPSACFAAYNLFSEAEPRPDGSYSADGERLMQSIREHLRLDKTGGHPFVLKSIYPDVAYSEGERRRINSICRRKNFTLLEDLAVNESAGDRLAYICRVPRDN